MRKEITDMLPLETGELVRQAAGAMLAAGDRLRQAQHSRMEVSLKNRADYVTQHDIQTENALREAFMKILPGSHCFGEEGERGDSDGLLWFIDPIDGTTNFVHGRSEFAISAALWHTAYGPVFGLVHAPALRLLWGAVAGEGAWKAECGGDVPGVLKSARPIHVSDNATHEGSIVLFGTPYKKKLIDDILPLAREMFLRCDDVRRLGAASLDMCSVAEGSAELYFEPNIHIWDIAAGAVLVAEAGGRVLPEDIADRRRSSINIIASNGKIPADPVMGILDVDIDVM